MKRATCCVLVAALSAAPSVFAQDAGQESAKAAQVAAVSELVSEIAKAEQALTSLRLTMTTAGRLPGGLSVETRGELRVLRGTQPDAPVRTFSRLEYSFGEGLKGRMEAARGPDGIVLFEEDPAFGAVYLHIDAATVADIEWAGQVLKRSDLPGMPDGRADSPLGAGLIRDLATTFDFAVERGEHGGDDGRWLRGPRKQGLDEQDPELPVADRVELFVRDRDHALLLARFYVGDEVVQSVTVEALECGVELADDAFSVDGRGLRRREVQDYAPMWEQIEDTLQKAEARAEGEKLRPSRRKRDSGKGNKD